MMDAEDQSPESNDSKEEFKPDENTALLRDAKPAQYELSRLTTPRLSRKKHVSVIWSVSLGIVLLVRPLLRQFTVIAAYYIRYNLTNL